MRIAVSYDNGEIFQHFGMSPQFKFYDVNDTGKIIKTEVLASPGRGHSAVVGFMQAQKVTAVITGGIGGGARIHMQQAGIPFYPGVTGSADKAVADFLAGTLVFDSKAMPSGGCGCSEHKENH